MVMLIEANLRRYLLGDLSDEEQTALETDLFNQPAACERLAVAEDELIDAYVLKELSASEERRFEDYVATSRRVAQRVYVAQALLPRAAAHQPRRWRTR